MGSVVGVVLGCAEKHEHTVALKSDDCSVVFLDDGHQLFKILIEHGDELVGRELGGHCGKATQIAHKCRDKA